MKCANRPIHSCFTSHGSALVGSDPHDLAPGFEVCQMKVTHIGVSELTSFKSYEIGPFENSTTVLLDHKVKSKIWIGNQKIKQNKTKSLYPLCIIKFPFWTILRAFYSTHFLTTAMCQKLTTLKLEFMDPKWKFFYAKWV